MPYYPRRRSIYSTYYRRRRTTFRPRTTYVTNKRSLYLKKRKVRRQKFMKSIRHKPSVSRPPAIYTDSIATKLKMHWFQNGNYNTFDTTIPATINRIMKVRLNAGGNQRNTIWYGDGTSSAAVSVTKFLNWEPFSIRYNSCRPIGCKVHIIFSCPDTSVEIDPNVPLFFAIFPYLKSSSGGLYSNEWDESATVPYTPEDIGNMKYGKIRRYYGAGSKSHVSYTKYFSFPKLAGRTYGQFMSDNNFNYNTTLASSQSDPLQEINLAILPADLVSDSPRTYNIEVYITQYVKFESSRLSLEQDQ